MVEGGRIVERGTHQSLYASARPLLRSLHAQHGLEANLFLAPGEGDIEPEAQPANGESNGGGRAPDADLPDAIRMIRDRRT